MLKKGFNVINRRLLMQTQHLTSLLLSNKLPLYSKPIFSNLFPTIIINLLIPYSSFLFLQILTHLVLPLQPTNNPTWPEIVFSYLNQLLISFALGLFKVIFSEVILKELADLLFGWI